jgi:peroxiredoxin
MERRRLEIGAVAPDFSLPGVDGRTYTLANFVDKKIVVVIFSCNHCPYVQAYEARMIAVQDEFAEQGVALVAINANETEHHPQDDFPNMVQRAKEKGFNFPYLRDAQQTVADAYGAHYTPEIFLLDAQRRLRYTGRIDDNWQVPDKVISQDLRDALRAVLSGEAVACPETHAVGCTIKWAK